MRLRDIFSHRPVLAEAHIANMRSHPGLRSQTAPIYSVEQWLNDTLNIMPDSPKRQAIARWLDRKVKRYLAGYDGAALKQITPNFARKLGDSSEQPWLNKAADAGEKVFMFSPTADIVLTTAVSNIVDWMSHLAQDDPAEFAKIDRYSFEQADQAQRQWHTRIAKRAKEPRAATVEGAEKVLDLGAYAWWRLDQKCALKGEGDVMGHCVGGYGDRVESGTTRIFSLRDNKGRSHVTVEATVARDPYRPYTDRNKPDAKTWAIEQVKGKGNDAPVDRYHAAVQALVDALGLQWGSGGRGDMERGGAIQKDGKYLAFGEVAQKVAEQDGFVVYAYAPKPLYRGDQVKCVARVFRGKTPLLTARFWEQADSWPVVYRFEVDDNATADDLIEAYPFLWATLRRDHPQITLKKNTGFRPDDARRYIDWEIREIVAAAGYVELPGGGWGTPDDALSKARAEVLEWVDDRSQNGYGAISTFVKVLQKYGGKSMDEALAEVKKIIPKTRLTPKIKAYAERTGDVYLYREQDDKSWSIWFWSRESNRIYERMPGDLT